MKAWIAVFCVVAVDLVALGIEPVVTKLFSTRADGNTTDDSFALDMDGSDRFLLVGETGNNEKGAGAGAAYLFDALTGRLKRKLLAPDAEVGNAFGTSVAVSGNRMVIGAPNKASGTGAAYVFDTDTGKFLGRLLTTAASTGDLLGTAVALEGDIAVVSAPGDDGGQGSVFVFNIKGMTGQSITETRKIVATVRVPGSGYGFSVATDGRIVVIGANQESFGNGAVYWSNIETGVQLVRRAGTAAEGLGRRVAVSGQRIFAGAPDFNSQRGRVQVFDTISGILLTALVNPLAAAGDQFGFSLAAERHLLLVGQIEENTGTQGRMFLFQHDGASVGVLSAFDGTNDDKLGGTVAIAGDAVFSSADPGGNSLVYRFGPVVAPQHSGLTLVAKLKDAAPGVGAQTFGSFGALVLGENDGQEIMFSAKASGGKVDGVWDRLESTLQDFVLSTDNLSPVPVGEVRVSEYGAPIFNSTTYALVPGLQRTPPASGVKKVLLTLTPSLPTRLVGIFDIEGGLLNLPSPLGSLTLNKMLEVTQSRNASPGRHAVACSFKVGVNGVNAGSDSGIYIRNSTGNFETVEQEGKASPGGPLFGQFSPRVAFSALDYCFSARMQSDLFPSGLFVSRGASGGFKAVLATGNTARTAGAGTLSTFIGETISTDDFVIFRSTLKGTGISVANNEAIITSLAGLPSVLDKGKTPDGLEPGQVISRFIRFWSIAGGQALVQAQIKGPKVTAANDVVLVLFEQGQPAPVVVFREGDVAPGCDGSRIGVINSVEVDHRLGICHVLASLTGSVAGRDQALFSSDLNAAAATQNVLRKPRLQLRKGVPILGSFGGVSAIKSMTFGTSSADASGAAGKGLSASANGGEVSLKLTFNDGSVHAVSFQPD